MFCGNDIKDLSDIYDIDVINKLDPKNVNGILEYLIENGIYYAKDLLISDFILFLMDKEEFIKKFENLKEKLGNNYLEILEVNPSYFEELYKD